MISIRGVSKAFGTNVVLDDVSLDIPDGQTTTIVGPSGVGKSVLLKLIMGILRPDAGEIYIGQRNITAASSESERNEIRDRLGVLFQSAALFDSLSVYDNIAFPLEARTRLSRSQIHSKVTQLIQSLSLERYAFRLPQEISIGVRKRVGMARCLVTEPKFILVDEPNTGLDPFDGQEVYNLIRDCRARWGFTAIVVSHELPEVFQISDRVVMLLGGKIIVNGTPDELLASGDARVQQFIQGRTDGPIQLS